MSILTTATRMSTKEELEAARLSMTEANRVLGKHEARKDGNDPKVHALLSEAFQKAAAKYLRLSGHQALTGSL